MEEQIRDTHDQSRSHYNEGRAFLDEGDLDSAIKSFQKTLEFAVHFKTLELLGECFLKKASFNEAIIYLAAAVTLNKGVRAASLLAEAMVLSPDPVYNGWAGEFVELALVRDSKNRKALELKAIIEKRAAKLIETEQA